MTRPPNRFDEDVWIKEMLDDLGDAPVPDVPDALLSRVLGDGMAQLPAPGGAPARAQWWRQIVEGLGGWSAVGGLVAAAATGFVLGLGGLEDLGGVGLDRLWPVSYETYYDSQDAYSAFGWDIEEG